MERITIMSIANSYNDFRRELNLIAKQNPRECELYSIIAQIIREQVEEYISLRDVSVARKDGRVNAGLLRSTGGFPDFVVLTMEYNFEAPDVNDILGAVEAKSLITKSEEMGKPPEQVKRHINKFEKVIYTNGLEWQFYLSGKPEEGWDILLGSYEYDRKERKYKIQWESKNEKWIELCKRLNAIVWTRKAVK